MRYGVIDIGSNTIRAVAYEFENRKAVKVEDKLVRSHIPDEIEEERLTPQGQSRLAVVLNKLVYLLKEAGCKEIGCFSTASLRGIKNLSEVQKFLYEMAGVQLDPLSAVREAEYDFAALRASVPEHCGIGLDLGGGSCQILQFEQSRLVQLQSLEIGSYRMKSRFVKNALPTPEERAKISFFVRNEMMDVHNVYGSRYLYAMGGTAKAALKLYHVLSNAKQKDSFLSVQQMEKLIALGDHNPEDVYRRLEDILKNRAETIIPGLTILKTICEFLETDGAYVLQCSIREGYFMKMCGN